MYKSCFITFHYMKKLVYFSLLAATLVACKKDSENTPSKTDLLTAKAWKVTSMTKVATVDGQKYTETSIDPCEADDSFQFKADKSIVFDQGATKCDPTNPQQVTGTWAFSNKEQTKLKVTLPNNFLIGEAEIKELTPNSMQLYFTYADSKIAVTANVVFSPK